MVQGGHGSSLAFEAAAAFGTLLNVAGQHFQCDIAAQSKIASAINLAHPPAPSGATTS
jgi:hypothetical protein